VDGGQEEGGGFAGSGLRDSEDITASHGGDDGFVLYGSGGGVAALLE
jgi:hypothetical protein